MTSGPPPFGARLFTPAEAESLQRLADLLDRVGPTLTENIRRTREEIAYRALTGLDAR